MIVQAIQKHKFVNILDNPGSADLGAYVDFPAIRHSAEEVSGARFTSFTKSH
jgi:NADH dehydrogenase [ubiquinone] 1 alpha subcomplex assembly factor 7